MGSVEKSRKKRRAQGKGLAKRQQKNRERNKFKLTTLKEVDRPIWRPQAGQLHTIDIIPYVVGDNDPEVESGDETYTFNYEIHQNVGPSNQWFICPRAWRKPCPICEHRESLIRKREDKDIYKQYFPKPRNLYNIWCHDSDEETKKGVQIWDVAFSRFEEPLLDITNEPPENGAEEISVPFAHPKKGKSIRFNIKKPKTKEDFDQYKGHRLISRSKRVTDEILDQVVIFDEAIVLESYDVIKKEFYGKGEEVSKKPKDESVSNDSDTNYEDLLDELEDVDDWDELEDFCDDKGFDTDDLDLDEDGKISANKKKVAKHIKSLIKDSDGKTKDDDNKSQDDTNKPKFTWDEIHKLSWVKLKKLVKSEDLEDEIDIDDYEKSEKEDLADDICTELAIQDE